MKDLQDPRAEDLDSDTQTDAEIRDATITRNLGLLGGLPTQPRTSKPSHKIVNDT